MFWIAPSEKDTASAALEKHLWDTADTAARVSASSGCEATWRDFRGGKDHWSVNSILDSQEYSTPVLGLISLRFDFFLANPPFNVNAVNKERLKETAGPRRRFPFGLPRTDNATATRARAKSKLS